VVVGLVSIAGDEARPPFSIREFADMKLLTFLGTGRYQTTRYVWNGQSCETQFFPEAVHQWLAPSETIVFLTADASSSPNWAALQQRLPARAVAIPSGRTEEELWAIFQILADQVAEGDEVAVDVTHGFHSLPMLSILALAYVRAVRNFELKHLLYGAFEAQHEGATPVFDLTPFLGLLDWLTAASTFRRTGDARDLAKLLKQAHRLQWRAAAGSENEPLPQHLNSLGDALEDLSRALLLIRPKEVAKAAPRVRQRLDQVGEEAAQWARPFSLLLADAVRSYADLGDSLESQLRQIEWYVENGHTIQAIVLTREWLISWACATAGMDLLKDRETIEKTIGDAAATRRGQPASGVSAAPSTGAESLAGHPAFPKLLDTWNAVSTLRNDIAHCGMNVNPQGGTKILQTAAGLMERLKQLPLPPTAS